MFKMTFIFSLCIEIAILYSALPIPNSGYLQMQFKTSKKKTSDLKDISESIDFRRLDLRLRQQETRRRCVTNRTHAQKPNAFKQKSWPSCTTHRHTTSILLHHKWITISKTKALWFRWKCKKSQSASLFYHNLQSQSSANSTIGLCWVLADLASSIQIR